MEVLQQNIPRKTIHRQMMNGYKEPIGLVGCSLKVGPTNKAAFGRAVTSFQLCHCLFNAYFLLRL